MSEQNLVAPALPEVRTIDGTEYVWATDAARYLGVHYSTVSNMVNSHQRYLVGLKWGALFVTRESLEAEKARRDAEKAGAA